MNLKKEYREALVGRPGQQLTNEDIKKSKEALIGRPGQQITTEDIKRSKELLLKRPESFLEEDTFEKGKKYKKGGKVKSASARADGCAQRGKTRGKMI